MLQNPLINLAAIFSGRRRAPACVIEKHISENSGDTVNSGDYFRTVTVDGFTFLCTGLVSMGQKHTQGTRQQPTSQLQGPQYFSVVK